MPRSRTITHSSHGVELWSVHPGEILVEEFLKPFGISQYRIAKDTRVPPRRINEIVHGMRSITADRSPAGTVLWDLDNVLDEPSAALRSGG